MFLYPQSAIQTTLEDSYNAYWRDRYDRFREDRKATTVGGLNDFQKDRVSIIAEIIKKTGTDPVRVTDIASGDGGILLALKQQIPISYALGVDSSNDAIEEAKKFGIETRLIDIRDPKAIETLPPSDYMLMLEILEHIPHSESLLRAAYGNASRGVFFSFPNTGYFLYRLRLLFGRMPVQWRIHPSEHVRFWTYADLLWWLDALHYSHRTIVPYQGVRFLKKLWPSLFAAAFVVYLPHGAEKIDK